MLDIGSTLLRRQSAERFGVALHTAVATNGDRGAAPQTVHIVVGDRQIGRDGAGSKDALEGAGVLGAAGPYVLVREEQWQRKPTSRAMSTAMAGD